MAVGSGLASSVGLAAETTYGTPVTVSRFLEINKPSLQKVKNTTQGGGLAAGRLVAPASRRVVTSRAAKGSLDLDVVNKGMGLLLAQIFGGAPAPVQQGATTAYLQTHPLTDNIGRSLTVQAGVPDLGGTVRPYTYQGAKVTDAEFDCGADDLLGLKVNLDIQDVTEATALVAPSYAATQVPFHWGQGTVKLGTSVGSEVAVDGVRKVNVKIARGQKTDRFYYGGGGVKKEPVTNAMTKITGTFETDFLTKADFADRYRDDTQLSLVWEFIGPQISGVYYQTFRLRVPALFLDEGTPQVDGPDVVKPKFTWTALHDGVNAPITCELITTDTTL